jgi:hypothetical protein
MSVHVMSWVFKHSEAEGNERMCLLVLANYADEDGFCWPSLPRVAHEMRVSVRTAQRCLRSLVDNGHLEVEFNGAPDSRIPANKKTNAYRIRGGRGDSVVTPADPARGDSPGALGVTLLSPKPPTDPSVTLREANASLRCAESSGVPGSAEKISAKKKSTKHSPEAFEVTAEMRVWASENARGVDIEAQTEQFLDWWRATGREYKNSVAAWRNWLRRSNPGGLAPWQKPDKTNRNPANCVQSEAGLSGAVRVQ